MTSQQSGSLQNSARDNEKVRNGIAVDEPIQAAVHCLEAAQVRPRDRAMVAEIVTLLLSAN